MSANCPTCGRALPKPKAPKLTHPSNAVDLTTISDSELFAYYKQTAPVEDVRFALKVGSIMSPELRADWERLALDAPVLARTEVYRRLKSLQSRWRFERNEAERQARAEALAQGIAKAPELYEALIEQIDDEAAS